MEAWSHIAVALEQSHDAADQKLAVGIRRFVSTMPAHPAHHSREVASPRQSVDIGRDKSR